MAKPPGGARRGIAKYLRIADIPAGLLALLALASGIFPAWTEYYRWPLLGIGIALTAVYFWFAIRGSYEQAQREAKSDASFAILKARRDMSPAAVSQRVTAMKHRLFELDRRASSKEDWEFAFGELQDELLNCLDDLNVFRIGDSWLTFMPSMPSSLMRLHKTAEKFGALVERFTAQEMKR